MFIDNFKFKLKSKSMVAYLVAFNVTIWLVFLLLRIILMLFNIDINSLLVLLEIPSSFEQFSYVPWSIITYCFIHTGFLHILFNMLILLWLGYAAEEYFSSRQILMLYLFGGVVGGATFLLAFNTIPYFVQYFNFAYLLGASASVLAIATAVTVAKPSYELRLFYVFRVPLKYVTIPLIFVSFFGVTGDNAAGDIAHLGGVFFGLVYALVHKQITRGRNIFVRGSRKERGPEMADFHFQRGRRDNDYTEEETARDIDPLNAELDEILAKIKRTGYASLTDEEKRRLFRH